MALNCRLWLVSTLSLCGLAGLVYWTNQQTLRLGAYESVQPLSEDRVIVPQEKVDIAASLAPFVMTFDSQGRYLAGNAVLAGQVPTLPSGVLSYAKVHGQNRLTWQPQPGDRQAIVVTYFSKSNPSFVLAGRSLREIEKREDLLLQ